jgi:hypothetical protein
MKDGIFSGSADDDIQAKVARISDFIVQSAVDFFDEEIVSYDFKFMVCDNTIRLMSSSTLITTAADESIYSAEHGVGHSDAGNSSESRNELDLEMSNRIFEILGEISGNRSTCCSNSSSCGPPVFLIEKYLVVLFKMNTEFPGVGDAILYRMIRSRIDSMYDQVPCCVPCFHMYLAAKRICDASRKGSPLKSDLPVQTFQPLLESEVVNRGKRPLACTTTYPAEPYSFALNVVESPYVESPKPVFVPSTSALRERDARKYKASQRVSMPKWVNRLISRDLSPQRRDKSKMKLRSSGMVFALPPVAKWEDLPMHEPSRPLSQILAERVYTEPTVDYPRVEGRRSLKS